MHASFGSWSGLIKIQLFCMQTKLINLTTTPIMTLSSKGYIPFDHYKTMSFKNKIFLQLRKEKSWLSNESVFISKSTTVFTLPQSRYRSS